MAHMLKYRANFSEISLKVVSKRDKTNKTIVTFVKLHLDIIPEEEVLVRLKCIKKFTFSDQDRIDRIIAYQSLI